MVENNADVFLSSSLFISAIIGGCVLLLMYIIRMLKNNNQQIDVNVTNTKKNVSKTTAGHPDKEGGAKAAKKKSASAATATTTTATEGRWTQGRATDKHNYTHPWLLTSLKGHTGQVLDMDFSSNGKYLATCAQDRTVTLWCIRDLRQKDRKSLRVNLDYDSAIFVRWSPDSKAFIITRATDQTVEVYRVERKKDGSSSLFGPVAKAMTFPKRHAEDADVIGMGIATNGKFIMTCSGKTDLVLWNLKGVELATVDTYLMNTWCAKVSPCGRFVVASGFAPDVKVWEVVFSKNGEFSSVKRVFELSGHTSGIYDVAFDADSSHMATVSKDGSWKLYQTNVEYHKGEDPHLKITGRYSLPSDLSGVVVHIALSPNAEVVAISVGASVSLFSTRDGTLDQMLEGLYGTGPVEALAFDALGLYLFTAGERHVRVFHNVTGYRCGIVTARERLRASGLTAATKERLEKQAYGNEQFLKELDEKVAK